MNKLKGYLEKKDGEILGIASSEAQDRDGEVIKQTGWDLNNFEKNPVLLASHNHQSFPIGKATGIAIEDGKLMFKAVFSKATQEAKEAYALVKEGILNTFSVGFIPRDYEKDNSSVITKAELLEISLVSIPSNPEAVVLAKGMKNDLAKSMIKSWLLDDELKEQVKVLEEKGKLDKQWEGLTEEQKEKAIKHVTSEHKPATKDVKPSKKLEGKADKVEDIDLKLLQKTVGHLQVLCKEAKEKGGGNNE